MAEKSYIKNEFCTLMTSVILYFFKFKFKKKEKIVVKAADGIGDVLVKSKLIEELKEEYGKENIYFIFQESYKFLGELLECNTIIFSRKENYNFIKRSRKMYFINKLGIKKFINLEFTNDNFIRNIYADEKIGIFDNSIEAQENNEKYTKKIYINSKTVLEVVKEMGETILNKKLTTKDIIPDLREKFNLKREEGIVIAVGSTARDRVCSPYKMIEYIKKIQNIFPEENIYLIGNGEMQRKYSKKVKEILNNEQIIDLVDTTTLKEAFEKTAKAKLFIGFESGLYNLRFTLRKPVIALFRNVNVPFAHRVEWVKLLGPDEKTTNFKDEDYPNEAINSISVDSFDRELKSIKENLIKDERDYKKV